MDASIGIMAYNEEKNIGNLLKTLLNQKLSFVKGIIVVDDGSIDKTTGIVQKFLKNKKIKLISLKKRGGKVNAINHFLKTAKSDIIILESADTIPHKNAIKELFKEFKNSETGIVSAHITPVNKGESFANFFGTFIYKLHHEIALKNPKFGELIAFRNVINKLPMTAVDEECLAMLIKNKGYKLKYCPKAIVYNKQPTNIRDIIKQRRRINVGHMHLKKLGYTVPTYDLFKILRVLIKNLELKMIHYIFLAIISESFIRFLSFYDTYIKKNNHFIWDVVTSTKNIKHGTY